MSRRPTISGIANNPIPTTMSGTPSIKYSVLNVNLGSPVIGAVPIDPIINPKKHAVMPLMKLSPARAPTMRSAKIIRRNCSPKPKDMIIGIA